MGDLPQLKGVEVDIIAFIGMHWLSEGRLVSPIEISEKFQLPLNKVNNIITSPQFKKSLYSRGIPSWEAAGLTPEQITVINTLANPMDNRAERKKLESLGVSAAKYQGWKKNPAFEAYRAKLHEDLLREAIPDAHFALVENVRRGDLNSMKLLYEMTGRFTQTGPADLKSTLIRVFEIIAKHITDSNVLLAIANDLKSLDQPVNVVGSVIQLTPGPVANEPQASPPSSKDLEL